MENFSPNDLAKNTKNYIEALVDGRTAFLTNLARQCGERPGGYKFFWISLGLEIFVDDLKFLLRVKFKEQIVCSNEQMIFVEGDWWRIVEPHRKKTQCLTDFLLRVERLEAFWLVLGDSMKNNLN